MSNSFFMGIPMMQVPSADTARVNHYGAGSYVICLEDTTREQYEEYLQLIEKSGFIKHSDNGAGFSLSYVDLV